MNALHRSRVRTVGWYSVSVVSALLTGSISVTLLAHASVPADTRVLDAARDGVITRAEREYLLASGVDGNALAEVMSSLRHRRLRSPGGGPYFVVPLRSPLTYGEMQTLARRLELTVEQTQYIESVFAAHRDRVAEDWLSMTAPIWPLSAAGAALDSADPAYPILFEDVMLRTEIANRGLIAAESSFWNEIALVLAPAQLARMGSVKQWRDRVSVSLDSTWYPGWTVDLSSDLWQLAGMNPCSLGMGEEWCAELDQYERRLTELVASLRATTNEAEILRARSLNAIQLPEASIEDQRAQLKTRMQASMRPISYARAIHDLNVEKVQSWSKHLPDDMAKQLLSSFQARAYPPIYPRPMEVDQFIRDQLESGKVSDIASAHLVALGPIVEAECDRISNEMVQTYLEWREFVAQRGGVQEAQYYVYRTQMLRLLKSRYDVLIRTIDQVQAIMPANRRLAELRGAYLEDLRVKSNPHGGRGFGWPDPTDDYDR